MKNRKRVSLLNEDYVIELIKNDGFHRETTWPGQPGGYTEFFSRLCPSLVKKIFGRGHSRKTTYPFITLTRVMILLELKQSNEE